MYSKSLQPEIMRTMLPEDFPADKLSRPRYKVTVERDVMIPMRDGALVAADIWRPDVPGKYPAIHAASPGTPAPTRIATCASTAA